ncbi:DUF177 domain-containing protein [Chloroflexota bacterium]
MQINVSQLLKDIVGATREYEIKDAFTDTDGNTSPIQGKVKLTHTQRGILVKGNLQTGAVLNCSRCLCQFHAPIRIALEEEYAQLVDVTSGTPLPLPGEAGTFTIDEHHILDLTEAARQYRELAIPMKPLCDEDCAGLCPSCGANLNQGTCSCPPVVIDPRWANLIKQNK